MQYFRVAGDQCYGGDAWEKLNEAKQCPPNMDVNCTPLVPPPDVVSPPTGASAGTVFVALLATLLVLALAFLAFVCVAKKPAGAYALVQKCVPGKDKGYRKLNMSGGASDTTSFFDDDELAE